MIPAHISSQGKEDFYWARISTVQRALLPSLFVVQLISSAQCKVVDHLQYPAEKMHGQYKG